MIALWVVGAVLIGALMIFTAYASTVGGLGALTGQEYERCPRCGHHSLGDGKPLHATGCPRETWPARLLHHRPAVLHLPRH